MMSQHRNNMLFRPNPCFGAQTFHHTNSTTTPTSDIDECEVDPTFIDTPDLCTSQEESLQKPAAGSDILLVENIKKETIEISDATVNPNNRVGSENFSIQRVVGRGGYGKVFLVQKVDGVDKDKLYAMKVLKKAQLVCNEKDKAHTVSERNILQMLRHPFLVKLHYAFQNHSNLYIVLEYCPGGELFNHLEREGCLLENSACFYTAEIALAIGHLHSLGIIYRDLKSENVLLDRQGHVKLTDFGLSKEGVNTTNTFCGTIEYMAPEIIRCEGHGREVDWWSLGTLLYDMLSGGPPFSQEGNREETTRNILSAPIRYPQSFSSEVVNLIDGLLRRNPRERLGYSGDVEDIKRHRFFRRQGINWSDVYHRRLKPPFKPRLKSDHDVSMFDASFTQLQPVVSPTDSTRHIPSDLFQGFSYVAPSVCDDHLTNVVDINSNAGLQRNGLSDWCDNPLAPDLDQASSSPRGFASPATRNLSGSSGSSVGLHRSLGHSIIASRPPPLPTIPSTGCLLTTTDQKPQSSDMDPSAAAQMDVDDCEGQEEISQRSDDDEEELEDDDNVPGATSIGGSHLSPNLHTTTLLPTTTATSPMAAINQPSHDNNYSAVNFPTRVSSPPDLVMYKPPPPAVQSNFQLQRHSAHTIVNATQSATIPSSSSQHTLTNRTTNSSTSSNSSNSKCLVM